MAWSTITTDAVLDEFTPQEQAALQAMQGASTQQGHILTRVVAAARGNISAGGNRLGATGTIPDQVVEDVIAIVRWRWLLAFPGLKSLQTKERKDAYDEAMGNLKDIAKGLVKVEVPAVALDEPAPIGAVEFKAGKRRATSRRMEGLT